MDKNYKRVVPKLTDTWKPEETGAILEGKLVNIESNIGKHSSFLYTIKEESGEEKKVWGSVALDSRMKEIIIGTNIEIEFLGEQLNPNSGNKYKSFEVGILEE